MKHYQQFSIFVILLVLFNSCEKGITDSNNALSFIDISNAESLVIMPSNSAKKGTDAEADNIMFKITEEGDLEEVFYYDDKDQKVEINPQIIYDVDSVYLIVGFGDSPDLISDGYLVSKTDGVCFSLNDVGFPVKYNEREDLVMVNKKVVFTDAVGNIYYSRMTSDGANVEVVKLDVTNADAITYELYSPASDHVEDFVVDSKGNLAYVGRPKSSEVGTLSICRIKKANGGIYEVPDYLQNIMMFWYMKVSDNFYYTAVGGGINGINVNDEYEVNNNTTDETISWGQDAFATDNIFCHELMRSTYLVINTNRQIVEMINLEVLENYSESQKFKQIHLSVNSNNYIYINGTNLSGVSVLVKFDPITKTKTELISGGYSIYKMVVSLDDVITFNALRLSDGAIVLGTIDENEHLTILDETLTGEVNYLERIN